MARLQCRSCDFDDQVDDWQSLVCPRCGATDCRAAVAVDEIPASVFESLRAHVVEDPAADGIKDMVNRRKLLVRELREVDERLRARLTMDEFEKVVDPLGYDTNRPIEAVAREMAEAALSGRNKDAVAEELARVRRFLGKRDRGT